MQRLEPKKGILLLRHWIDPVQWELGQLNPVFSAIRRNFPRGVRLLLYYSANTEAQQNYSATMADSSWCGAAESMLRSRTTHEAAADCPRLLMLQGRKTKIATNKWNEIAFCPISYLGWAN